MIVKQGVDNVECLPGPSEDASAPFGDGGIGSHRRSEALYLVLMEKGMRSPNTGGSSHTASSHTARSSSNIA